MLDIKHNFIEKGTGEYLILLHGNGENLSYFKHQLDFFSKSFHVIALDTRGHGNTPRGEAPFTIRQFADDLYAFMDNHNIPKAHILGFSDGGNIAMIFALKYPDKVDKLILNGANLFGRGVKMSVQLPVIYDYCKYRLSAQKNPKAKRKAELYGLMVFDPNLKPRDLKAISSRTLVIAGENDMIKTSHTKLIHSSLSDSELAIIPGNHFIAYKNYKTFNSIVYNFLQKESY